MPASLTELLAACWVLLQQTAPALLAGLVVAGIVEGWISRRRLAAWLGGERPRGVVLATLIGAPLPLCSCAVLPAALALRRGGAGKGPTLAFLISTPETSVTSILVTYALIGPVMTVARPLAAMLTALTAGLAQTGWRGGATGTAGDLAGDHAAGAAPRHEPTPSTAAGLAPATDAEIASCARAACGAEEGLPDAPPGLRAGLAYAFSDLLDDIFGWVLLGIVAAAALLTWLPAELLAEGLPGWAGLLGALLIGVPLYICAEASTPVAAALMAQGLSPGAALVLLLAGPATNLGALGLLRRELGNRSVGIYLGAIVVVSLAAGAGLDLALGARAPQVSAAALAGNEEPGGAAMAAAVFLLACGVAARLQRRRASPAPH